MRFRKTGVILVALTFLMGICAAAFFLTGSRKQPGDENKLSLHEREAKRVLVLNSYHPGYVWEDSVIDGIRSVLDKSGQNLKVSYEFMDTKRHRSDLIDDALRWLYRLKYQNTDFHVIITSDNNALNFLLSYGEDLFPGVPVVFCGINGYNDEMLGGRSGVTGIAEDYDLKGTLDIALSMHPDTQNVAVVSGVSTSSIINQAQLRALMPAYEDQVDFIDLSAKTIHELTQALRDLPEKTIVLYISYYLTPGGKTLTVAESTSLVFKNANLPIYSPWEYTLGNGVLGGMMLSGWDQGRIASETALKILGGVSADKIPVLRNSSIQPVFDYKILKHFGIPLSKIPKGAVIRNEPQTFYYKYKAYFWAIMGFILYQTITIFVLIRIIARRKRAEASLRLEEARLEALLELNRMVDAPMDRILRSALEKAAALIGSSAGYLVRLSPKETVESLIVFRDNNTKTHSIPEGLEPVCEMQEIWKKAIARKSPEFVKGDKVVTPFTCEVPLFTNGLIFPIFENDRPVAVAGFGNKDGDYGSSDIRQLSLLAQGVQEIMRRKRAEERQNQLEAELIQAQKMEAIGTFAGGIAHDFNNILGAVTTCSELMLEDTSKEDPAHEDLTHIIKAASRGKELVKQILAFSRKSDQERQPVQMKSLLNECMELLKAFMPPTIDLRLNIRAESGLVLADPTQIHQVIMNLCTNAEHAMRGKSGTLQITLEAVDLDGEAADAHPDLKPGRYSRLSVADTGSGMDPSVVKRIFDPFYTTRQQSGGTGLGLSMSHGIVKRHGGAIIVESQPGKGTVFYVFLPCAHVAKDPLGMETSGTIPRGNERILLVDDDENVLYAEKKLLERLGYDVVGCNVSLEALKRFKADPEGFDLLVTDQMMPFMTGMELARKMLDIRSDIPVLLCSGFDDDNISKLSPAKITAAGIGGYIAKPFTRHEVGEMVRHLLDKDKNKDSL